MSFPTRIVGLAATAVISLGGAVVAPALASDDAPTTDPCASQQAKVDKAEDALARVTAVFAHQKVKVEKARAALAHAEAGNEKAAAQRALAAAKAKKDAVKDNKRAQQMRLAKAQERLTECQAAQPTETPTTTTTPTATPTTTAA